MNEKIKLIDICSPKQWKTIATNQLLAEGEFPVYGANGIIGYFNEFNHEEPTVLITCRGATCGNIHISLPRSYINGNAMALDNLDEKICLKEYLYYFLNYYDMTKIISGSAQPQITIQGLKKIYVKLYSIEEQKNIVYKMNSIKKIINIRKKQIQQFDELIKSQFVEMFGDVKKNDKNWNYTTLGKECILNPKKSELQNISENYEISFVAMPSVSENGNIDTSVIKKYCDVKKGFTYFAENDVLFAKITPCMENGKGAVAVGLKNKVGFGSTEFHVLRPKENINSVWLYTLTAMKSFRIEAERKMTGSAGQKRVPISFFETYNLGLPPLELQNKFAEFVKRIDKQKSEIEKSLKEMQELYESLMDKYFG